MGRVMYSALDAGRITSTARDISRRLTGQFPGSGLSGVSVTLCELAEMSAARAERLSRPDWRIRTFVAVAVVLLVAIAMLALMTIRVPGAPSSWSDFAQGLEAGVSDAVFFGLALFFLFSLESRSKRRLALAGLNGLRSIAHVIDMHQLAKDPQIGQEAAAVAPRVTMTQVEMAQYLDYCSELLSVTSKLAALHTQAFSDSAVLDSVNGIQDLTVGLSGKIWQKIMILDLIAVEPGARARHDG